MPTKKKRNQGRKNRAAGARLELKVRAELEKMGWVVTKWMNTIDYEKNKIVPAKRKFNPFLKILGMGTGFPDFVCFKRNSSGNYDVIAVEVKANGYLDSIERGMCQWMLENKIFNKIKIAKKGEKRGKIDYIDFAEKYN
ncbi:MAG: hypothetical protein NTW17_00345 [Candidatus Pacearchaeota archaeon]|nr:hypothetical protein [Candidatus Pacearchaeota archaeon]